MSDNIKNQAEVSSSRKGKSLNELSNRQLKRLLNSALRAKTLCPQKCVSRAATATENDPAKAESSSGETRAMSGNECVIDSIMHDVPAAALQQTMDVDCTSGECDSIFTGYDEQVNTDGVQWCDDENFEKLLSSEQSFGNFLLVCDQCERCGSCVCLLECGVCVHDQNHKCLHCDTCNEFYSVAAAEFVEPIVDHGDHESSDHESSDHESSDHESSDTVVETANSIQEDLCEWAVNGQITHAQLRQLLKVLDKHHPEDNLPHDPRTLLSTVRNVIVRSVPPGLYWHNGIKKSLTNMLTDTTEESEICLSFNVDGVPISESSSSVLWPILCCLKGTNDVFVAGIYHGYAKPESEKVYLQDFVEEMTNLVLNGLEIEGKKFKVSLTCCACDAPAKSFILCIKGHSGYFSCTKCCQRGKMCDGRMSFPETDFVLRTDEAFISQEQPEHHLPDVSPPSVVSIPGFKPVSHVVLDPLHLLDLGVMKKLLMFWLFGSRSVKMGKKVCGEISAAMIKLFSFVPVEFQRRPRPLTAVCKYKGTELRQILMYIGPVIFRMLDQSIYSNFLSLHVATRILCSPDLCVKFNDYAGALMENFVTNFKSIYGEQYVSHNVHGCLHIHRDVLLHGPLDDFSVYKFESFLQKLKSLVRKSEKPLQQIAKRYSEMEAVMMGQIKNRRSALNSNFSLEHNSGPVVDGCGFPQYKVYKSSGVQINVTREGDRCVSLKDGSVVLVKNFAHHQASGQVKLIGLKFKFKDNLYAPPIAPIESSVLGIYKVFGLSTGLQSWSITQISRKLYSMPLKEGCLAVVPLQH